MRQSFLPGFDVPFVLVDVELDEQPELRLIGRLLDGEDPGLRIGARVHVAFEDLRRQCSARLRPWRVGMTGRFAARNQVAIVGYAQSPIERHAKQSLGALAVETARRRSPTPVCASIRSTAS